MWILFVAGAVLSWGAYGVLLHKGQVLLGNPLKALLCVGVAYFLIGVLVPVGDAVGAGGPVELQQHRPHDRDDRGRARRGGRRLHHLCIQVRAGCRST